MTVPYGFWVRGDRCSAREPVIAARAFAGFAACDEAACPDAEHYLSAFTFGEDFRRHLAHTGSTAEFHGECGSDWIWWDIDRADDIDTALADARALCLHLTEHWRVRDHDLLVFMSGSKGFHVGLPTSLWSPVPFSTFHRVTRRFATGLAREAGGSGVAIDPAVYDRVRIFRAPNSRHPKTGLRKRLFTLDELMGLGMDRIADLARSPRPFDIPAPIERNEVLAVAWGAAIREEAAEDEARRRRQEQIAASGGPRRLNSLTLDFIREGAPVGGPGTPPEAGRHNRLYAAARNLGEFGCTSALAHALLTEAALDCGLPPREVRRQIEDGLRDAGGGGANG